MRDISYFSSQGPTRGSEAEQRARSRYSRSELLQELPGSPEPVWRHRDRADSLADAGSQPG